MVRAATLRMGPLLIAETCGCDRLAEVTGIALCMGCRNQAVPDVSAAGSNTQLGVGTVIRLHLSAQRSIAGAPSAVGLSVGLRELAMAPAFFAPT